MPPPSNLPPKEDALAAFLPYIGQWFRENLGEPTPTQAQSWPHIRAKENTLILAPTGSGKTLAAFLVCLDELWREKKGDSGTRVLYLSPLKALNNDIQRNVIKTNGKKINSARTDAYEEML